MILNLIVFKNDKIGAFTTPNFTDLDPEVAAKQLERSLIINYGKAEVESYRNLDMYCLGTFDDENGKFVLHKSPKFLFSPRELMYQIMTKKANAKGDEVKEEAKL